MIRVAFRFVALIPSSSELMLKAAVSNRREELGNHRAYHAYQQCASNEIDLHSKLCVR